MLYNHLLLNYLIGTSATQSGKWTEKWVTTQLRRGWDARSKIFSTDLKRKKNLITTTRSSNRGETMDLCGDAEDKGLWWRYHRTRWVVDGDGRSAKREEQRPTVVPGEWSGGRGRVAVWTLPSLRACGKSRAQNNTGKNPWPWMSASELKRVDVSDGVSGIAKSWANGNVGGTWPNRRRPEYTINVTLP